MNYLNLKKARSAYKRGDNITEFLRKEFSEDTNTSEIIEISYDLQAGSYIEYYKKNTKKIEDFANELGSILSPLVKDNMSILDVGSGELTTLSLIMNALSKSPKNLYAFDLSWSRINIGKKFFEQKVNNKAINLHAFVADMKKIPLPNKSIDIVISVHALEPNGNQLKILLKELFRICKLKCVLFEPSYELNSREGQERMDNLGYIKNIEKTVKDMNGYISDIIPIKNSGNPLNPTACYIIEPPEFTKTISEKMINYTAPGTNYPLIFENNFWLSAETGFLFPQLNDIPILKQSTGILASNYFK